MTIYNNNLINLRKYLQDSKYDAIFVAMKNEFGNYKDEKNAIYQISGFSGSNGRAIISKDRAILVTDGRYTKQANDQVDPVLWEVLRYPDVDTISMLRKVISQGETLAIGAFSMSYQSYLKIEKLSKEIGFNIKILDEYPINCGKQDTSEVFLSGEEKINQRINQVQEHISDGEAYLTTDSSFISWALGLRIPPREDYSVLPRTVAYFSKGHHPIVFCDLKIQRSPKYFSYHHISEFQEVISKQPEKNCLIDYSTMDIYFPNILNNISISIKESKFNFRKFESVKTLGEIQDQRRGIDLASKSFIKTLVYVLNNEGMNEYDVAKYFESELAKNKDFVSFSFNPISAFGENTAIVHYNPLSFNNSVIKKEGLFLFDAGAHFSNSTTDMTRTVYKGIPERDLIRTYTMVLKSIIQFSLAVFPRKTRACQLDTIARNSIWKEGMNYNFGTGHGVGNFANVHELPRISKNSDEEIVENMIITVEPGIYSKTQGVRMENMLLTKPSKIDGFLEFETLSHIPFDQKLIDASYFDKLEIDWLNNYNLKILEKYEKEFENDYQTHEWLRKNTVII